MMDHLTLSHSSARLVQTSSFAHNSPLLVDRFRLPSISRTSTPVGNFSPVIPSTPNKDQSWLSTKNNVSSLAVPSIQSQPHQYSQFAPAPSITVIAPDAINRRNLLLSTQGRVNSLPSFHAPSPGHRRVPPLMSGFARPTVENPIDRNIEMQSHILKQMADLLNSSSDDHFDSLDGNYYNEAPNRVSKFNPLVKRFGTDLSNVRNPGYPGYDFQYTLKTDARGEVPQAKRDQFMPIAPQMARNHSYLNILSPDLQNQAKTEGPMTFDELDQLNGDKGGLDDLPMNRMMMNKKHHKSMVALKGPKQMRITKSIVSESQITKATEGSEGNLDDFSPTSPLKLRLKTKAITSPATISGEKRGQYERSSINDTLEVEEEGETEAISPSKKGVIKKKGSKKKTANRKKVTIKSSSIDLDTKKASARSKLCSITWTILFHTLLYNSRRKMALARRESANRNVAEEIVQVYDALKSSILTSAKEEIHDLIMDRKHKFAFKTADVNKCKKATKECEAFMDHARKIFNKLITGVSLLPDHFFKTLANFTRGGSLLPNDYFTLFELRRLKFTTFGTTKDMNEARVKLIIAGFVLLRGFIYNIIMHSMEIFPEEKNKLKVEKLLNIGSILYNAAMDVLQSSLQFDSENQSLLPLEMRTKPKRKLLEAADEFGENNTYEVEKDGSRDGEIISGFYAKHQLSCFFMTNKQMITELKTLIQGYLDTLYTRSNHISEKN